MKELAVSNRGYGVFPSNQKLWIYAAVLESASGIKYNVTDLTTKFTDSQFVIECRMSKAYYKPSVPLSGVVSTV